jgi:hypothetical protein
MARSFVVAFVALTAAAALLQGGAGAQTATATWEANPLESTAPVDVIVHSHTPCPDRGDLAIIRMLDGKTEVTKTIINVDDTTADWEGQFTVPADTAPGKYTLTANCAADETAAPDQTYEDLAFTVSEPETGETTTTIEGPENLKPRAPLPESGGVQELAAGPGPSDSTPATLPAATVTPATVAPIVASTPAQAVNQQPSFTG